MDSQKEGEATLLEQLRKLRIGLRAFGFSGEIRFTQEENGLREMASSSLRGLLGNLLLENHAGTDIMENFSPATSGCKPPAFVLRTPPSARDRHKSSLPFRLIAWDPEEKFVTACRDVLRNNGKGRTFGGSAMIQCITTDEAREEIRQVPSRIDRLTLLTPMRLKKKQQWIGPQELSLTDITRSLVRRLNELSRTYGNQTRLEIEPWLAITNNIQTVKGKLQWLNCGRYSKRRNKGIVLSGITGYFELSDPPLPWLELMSAGEVFHVGRHTSAGCGQLLLE